MKEIIIIIHANNGLKSPVRGPILVKVGSLLFLSPVRGGIALRLPISHP
jgi:hypothetical protein